MDGIIATCICVREKSSCFVSHSQDTGEASYHIHLCLFTISLSLYIYIYISSVRQKTTSIFTSATCEEGSKPLKEAILSVLGALESSALAVKLWAAAVRQRTCMEQIWRWEESVPGFHAHVARLVPFASCYVPGDFQYSSHALLCYC
jgi:hypothetical protein